MYECQTCGYYYIEQGERAPRCHYNLDDPNPAPCEYEDDYDDYRGEDDRYTFDDLGYDWY